MVTGNRKSINEVTDYLTFHTVSTILSDDTESIENAGVFLEGPPGIGKTTSPTEVVPRRVQEILTEIGLHLELVHVPYGATWDDIDKIGRIASNKRVLYVTKFSVAQAGLWDLTGIPSPLAKRIHGVAVNEWKIQSFLAPFTKKFNENVNSNPAGLMILDEANMVDDVDKLRVLFTLLTKNEIGAAQLIDKMVFVLTGNPSSYNPSAVNILDNEALRDRLVHIYVTPPRDPSTWIEYMNNRYPNKYDDAIAAFLVLEPDLLYKEEKGKVLSTPRKWTRIARTLYVYKRTANKIPSSSFLDHISTYVYGQLDEKTASRLMGFIKSVEFIGRKLVDMRKAIESFDYKEVLDIIKYAYEVGGKNGLAYAIIRFVNDVGQFYRTKIMMSPDDRSRRKLVELLDKITTKSIELDESAQIIVKTALTSLPMGVKYIISKYSRELSNELERIEEELSKYEEVLVQG